jgi:hypothetical protein
MNRKGKYLHVNYLYLGGHYPHNKKKSIIFLYKKERKLG